MPHESNARGVHVITGTVMPYALARTAVPYLKRTPEYEQARAEKRSRAWLAAESLSIGYAMAEVLRARLEDLDPDAGR
jgi:hypothetical protein